VLPFVLASAVHAEDGFEPLFNGTSLEGWTGDEKLWSVEDGVIVGKTTPDTKLSKNSFLATNEKYGNFVLRVKFKLENGNSGIQYRSQLHDNFRVTGYQADIADNKFMGILYEEGGRGILVNVKPEDIKPHVKAGEWNEYEITADGNKLTQKLNGFETVSYSELDANRPTEGVIALQLHVGPPMTIHFKDIELKPLP
jgi:hypothetical protein